jgi:hypothetical protein
MGKTHIPLGPRGKVSSLQFISSNPDLYLNVPINTLCNSGGFMHKLIVRMELFFKCRSVKILHLAAFRSINISIPKRLRNEGF